MLFDVVVFTYIHLNKNVVDHVIPPAEAALVPLRLTERASRFGLRSRQVIEALAESADARRRSGRLARGAARESLAHPPTAIKSYTPTPCTMRNLHAPSASPWHVMRGLRRHRASLARQETLDVRGCACLDHHRPAPQDKRSCH